MADTDRDGLADNRGEAPAHLEFLVGSWNRFEVLDALGTAPRTRDELMAMTGVSRPTLSRILSDLQDRGWVYRHDDTYEATPVGGVIATELDQVVRNVETAESLGGALEWLRTGQLGFDLAQLADAKVLTPTPRDHTAPMRYVADSIERTAEMRVVATGVTYQVVESICRAGIAGDLQFRCVLDDDALEGTRAHPELAAMFAEMIDQGHCEAFHYRGDDDLLAFNVVDDAVMFCGISAEGMPRGIVVSEAAPVRSWARLRFERRRAESDPIGGDAFTP